MRGYCVSKQQEMKRWTALCALFNMAKDMNAPWQWQ
jgi:hypothetical protein